MYKPKDIVPRGTISLGIYNLKALYQSYNVDFGNTKDWIYPVENCVLSKKPESELRVCLKHLPTLLTNPVIIQIFKGIFNIKE